MLAVDFIAREGHYHTSCQKDYTHTVDRNEKSNSDSNAFEEQAAHQADFECMRDYVKESIFYRCNVEQMSMLRE